MRYLFLCLLIVLSVPVMAQDSVFDPFRSTELPLPRFASVGSNEAFVRTGPGKKYPVQWVYRKKGLPVEIVLEFDHWRKVRDFDGQVGWLHKSLLSGNRTAMVLTQNRIPITRRAKPQSSAVAMLEPLVVVDILECGELYCRVDADGYKGWAEKRVLWGVYAPEILKD